MDRYLKVDEWDIIEENFHADRQKNSESIFSIGNGRIGQRGNFEEPYSSDSLQGSYMAGFSFMDRALVGWWKNGYPKYYSRVANAPNWSGILVRLIDEELNLAEWDIHQFGRTLHMQNGVLERNFIVTSPKAHTLQVYVEHFISMKDKNINAIKYSVTSIDYEGKISLVPFINGDVTYESAYSDKELWNILRSEANKKCAYLWAQIKRENNQVCCAMSYNFYKNRKEITQAPIKIEKEKSVGYSIGADIKPGETVCLYKYTSVISSLYYDQKNLPEEAMKQCCEAKIKGWDTLYKEHTQEWKEIWDDMDVEIEGDEEAQQAIRYNIFQLNQTYRGDDPRLNIGAKGFTGEKYGGNTYWNTELCCVPFLLLSTPRPICRNLLLYRYNHLPKAIKNAQKLGFNNGAALYPMVTIDGDESHNEWEITFEEIHRNGIIAYAIDQYTRYTGDTEYIAYYGLEVYIAICRFWSQRVSYSIPKQKYVLLGVTGPNEYENNVDNNWYTNYFCIENLKKALFYLEFVKDKYPKQYEKVVSKCSFSPEETDRWKDIIENIYLPEDKEKGIFIQHDGYMDKELKEVNDINPAERPINQYWSWDRILRSCFIKQGDVLLGIYLFQQNFSRDYIERNFRFYEPRTLHESSLSPFVHSILAARIGDINKAYDLFIRSARMDLDDYNNEIADGLHITSMPGSWLAIVEGFAGVCLENKLPSFNPQIPPKWNSYSFKINFLQNTIGVKITKQEVKLTNLNGNTFEVEIYKKKYVIENNKEIIIPLENYR